MKRASLKILRLFGFLISFLLHLIVVGIIAYVWQPIAWWYWNYRPILGVDFYHSVTSLSYLARHFSYRFNGWKYIWNSGYPLQFDYPSLHSYLSLPLLGYFSAPEAVQIYMLFSLILFLAFSYLLFYEIGRDRVLAGILSLAVSFSLGVYGALIWGGSLPYFATQFFYPLVLWSLLKYLKSQNRRWFFLSVVFLGVSLFAHPQVAFSFIIPTVFLILFLYPFAKEKMFSLSRIKRICIYFVLAILIGYPQLSVYLGQNPFQTLPLLPQTLFGIISNVFSAGRKVQPGNGGVPGDSPAAQTMADMIQWRGDQLSRLVTDIHPLFISFFIAAGIIFFITFVFRKKRKESWKLLVFSLPALWVIGYDVLYAYGIEFYHGGWYRVFWPLPVA